MNRTIALCTLVLTGLILGFDGAGAIGLRGGTWGELRYDIPKEGVDNLILDGWIKQGIDWMRWENTALNTYAAFRYKLDTEKYEWNNSVAPGIGISLDMYSPKGLILTVGAEYIWERQLYDGGDYYQKTVIYMNWVGWWDLKRR